MNADLWWLANTLRATPLGEFVRASTWLWAILESMHFIGMSLLIGTVGLFDLRLLGFARRVPIVSMHRLIPVGITGFALNLATGICFLCGAPEQYIFNNAFRMKMSLMLIAGLNILFFYGRVFRRLDDGADSVPPLGARIVGGISLTAWVGVMAAGRLLTFFRPPF